MRALPASSVVRIAIPFYLILWSQPAFSQTPLDWSGATDTTWATASNWGGTAPANDLTTNIANFNSAFTNAPNAGTTSIAGLAIGTGRTTAFTITSATTGTGLSLGASGINFTSTGTAFTVTLGAAANNQFTIAAPQTWNVTTAVMAITVNGTLNLNNTLTLTGAGTVRLANASTGSGGITSNSGRFIINNGGALGTGTFTIQGGTIDTGGVTISTLTPIVWDGNFTFQGTGALSFGSNSVNLGSTAGPRVVTVTANTLTVAGPISDGSGTTSLSKAGGGTLALTGTNGYTGTTTVTAGILTFGSTASIGGTGTSVTVNTPGIVAFQPADPAPLLTRLATASTGALGLLSSSSQPIDLSAFPNLALAAAGTNVVYSGVLTPGVNGLRLGGSRGILVYSGNTPAAASRITFQNSVTLTGLVDNSGPATFTAGVVVVPVFANGGSPSSIGSSSSAVGNLVFSGGNMIYSGPTVSSDRGFTLTSATTSQIAVQNALTLTGGTAATTGVFQKSGSGTLTLSGNDSNTGSKEVKGGTLVFDFSGGNDALNAASQLRLDSGTAILRAPATGTFTKTLNSVVASGLSLGGFSTLALDANGNPNGIQLTIASLISSATANISYGAIDTSSSATNSITATLGANLSIINGVVGYGSNNRAIYVMKDANGIGFLTTTATTSGTLGRLSPATAVDATNGTTTTNLLLTGTVNRTASLNFNTLTIDASAAPVALTFATGTTLDPAAASARGVLVYGGNDVTISGPVGISATSVFFSLYNTGAFTLGLGLNASTQVSFGGTGFVALSGAISATATNLHIGGPLFRTTNVQNLSTNTATVFTVSSGSVFEIGADVNGATAGDFSNGIGTTGGLFRFVGDSGVSAFGANRTVNFGGSTGQLTWGASSFLTNTDTSTDGGFAFKLSSSRSDSTVTVQNPINLNSRPRVVEVADGSAAIDARLSGVLSGVAASLVKSGAGTLELTGANTYSGSTTVNAGALRLGASNALPSASDAVLNCGTLALAAGTTNTGGSLSISSNSILDFGNAASSTTLSFVGSAGMAWNGTLSIVGYTGQGSGLTGAPTTRLFVGTDSTGLTSDQLNAINFSGYSLGGSATQLSTGEVVPLGVVPEPGTILGLAAAGLGLAGWNRRKRK